MNRRRKSRHRSRSRSRSRSNQKHNNNEYDRDEMQHRLKEIKHLRSELSKSSPSHSRYNNDRYRKYSEQDYIDRAQKRKATKVTISVWMESDDEDNHTNVAVADHDNVETFKDERKKHEKKRKLHIERHKNEIDQRTYHSEESDSDSSSFSSSENSISSSSSSTDSEYERRKRRKKRKKYKKSKKHKRKSSKRRKRKKKRKKKKNRKQSSSESEDESDEIMEKPKKQIKEVWLVQNDEDSSSENNGSDKCSEDNDDEMIGPQPMDDVSANKLDRRDYGGAMLPGEADAIANFVQRGMRIPRRGEVGLTSEEIAAFEGTGFVMSGSRHKRMNAIRIRKENQIYSAEEKRALTMVNFEEKLNREKKLMAQYQKLLNEKTKN